MLPSGPSLGAGDAAFILNGNCSYFPGKDKPLSRAQRGAARLTARGLSSSPHPAPCLSPAVSASFLMRAANLQSTCRWFWVEHSLSHCWKHRHRTRVNQRGEAAGKGGRARTVVDRVWAARGKPRSLLPKLNSAYSLTVPGISLLFFMQPNCRSST